MSLRIFFYYHSIPTSSSFNNKIKYIFCNLQSLNIIIIILLLVCIKVMTHLFFLHRRYEKKKPGPIYEVMSVERIWLWRLTKVAVLGNNHKFNHRLIYRKKKIISLETICKYCFFS